jgi:hypothetical protein
MSYLETGGNVLLLSRMGVDFVGGALQDYLGIAWAGASYNTLGNCVSAETGLVDMPFLGTQSYGSVFDTTFTQPETELLFLDTAAFSEPRGLGAWRSPAGGGLHRADGAQFAFISGRPYRYDGAALRANVHVILMDMFEEPLVPTAVAGGAPHPSFALAQNVPNPFNPTTVIRFDLPRPMDVSLSVFALDGRRVATLVTEFLDAGPHEAIWNGRDFAGRPASSGTYVYRLRADGEVRSRRLVLLR